MRLLVKVEVENRLGIVTIQNPPLNVMSKQVIEELDQAFQELETNEEVVAVLLTGQGQKAFVAGADIKEFPQLMGHPHARASFEETHAVLNRIDDFRKPTIVALNGMAFGGGLELALTCDMRIAEEHALLCVPEVKLGLFPGAGGTQRLPRVVGEAKAKEMMYTGEPITAEEALRVGLVNYVVGTGEAVGKAKALASKITRHSLQSLSRIKKAVDDGLGVPLKEGLQREVELFEEVFQTDDIKEGVSAFIEKRQPVFSHK
ncbi:enoyl-CoA hydratase [Priestia koreensis]|uniref:enoyl-CoA hydratase n=1 Tax=Priestia koreensis TaxID=284581 RepID=UPI001F580AFA|nr:enoyl-CoA hydratase-related protein [Priestia koreensis]UNL86562.1 enoyl-CoA hydratase [Priestia koreensis]